MSPPRAVLDTSVLVSVTWRKTLQIHAALGTFTGIWSPWIIAELTRVLTWRWAMRYGSTPAEWKRCGESCKKMMEILLPTFELTAPLPLYPIAWASLEDQWDLPVWAAAVEGHAEYVISESTRDFPPRDADGRHAYNGIVFLRPQALLDLLDPEST